MSHCNRSCVSRQSETVPAFEKITGWIDKRNKMCGEEASRPQMKCCVQVPSAGPWWNRDEDMPGGAVAECLAHYLPLRAQSKDCWRAPAASENNNERKITGSASHSAAEESWHDIYQPSAGGNHISFAQMDVHIINFWRCKTRVSNSHRGLPSDYIKSKDVCTCSWVIIISKKEVVHVHRSTCSCSGPALTRSC